MSKPPQAKALAAAAPAAAQTRQTNAFTVALNTAPLPFKLLSPSLLYDSVGAAVRDVGEVVGLGVGLCVGAHPTKEYGEPKEGFLHLP